MPSELPRPAPTVASRVARWHVGLLIFGVTLAHGLLLGFGWGHAPPAVESLPALTVLNASVLPTDTRAAPDASKGPETASGIAIPAAAKPAKSEVPPASVAAAPAGGPRSAVPAQDPVTNAPVAAPLPLAASGSNMASLAPANSVNPVGGNATALASGANGANTPHPSNTPGPATASGAVGGGKPGGSLELPSAHAAYLQNPPPEYPRISRQRGEQGRVHLRVLIDTDGAAQKTEIAQSSGYPRLDQAALNAVANWRFVPGKRNGQVEAMWFTVPVGFCLSADGVQCQP